MRTDLFLESLVRNPVATKGNIKHKCFTVCAFWLIVYYGFRGFSRMLGFIDGFTCFGWHVVLIVFREHLLCLEDTVSANLALRHAAASFFKQVGKNSFVDHRNTRRRVSHDKPDCQTIALQCALLDQAADAKRSIDGRLFRRHLSWTEKEDEIIPKCAGN